jgi:hypothetical protein
MNSLFITTCLFSHYFFFSIINDPAIRHYIRVANKEREPSVVHIWVGKKESKDLKNVFFFPFAPPSLGT